MARAALALARRFSAGATLWCVAPDSPAHARHVAVEFVHPVIVGTRALPAVALVEPDPAAALGTLARPGDAVLAIGAGPTVAAVLARASALGLTTVWLGPDEAPPAGAGHALGLPDPDGTAVHDGRVTLIHHVLWELTHVCFEHPGLLAPDPAPDEADSCVTCADRAEPGEVVAVDGGPEVTVRTAGGAARADATLAGDLAPGDQVLVHAGTVIAVTSR